jgi:uncharacterized glyoxalase superfamily protein PhnB
VGPSRRWGEREFADPARPGLADAIWAIRLDDDDIPSVVRYGVGACAEPRRRHRRASGLDILREILMSANASASTPADRAQPEPFRARAVSVSHTVKDFQASLAWYTDVVGFIVDETYERDGVVRAAALRAGATRLLIGQDDGAKGWDRVKGQGFSFQFTTAQDIDAIANGIKARGGTLELEPTDMPWGARIFRMTDPDGFSFSISSERPAKA